VRLFPTRSALEIAMAGAMAVLAGILLFQPAIVAWGGALILGLSAARALTLLSVARVRAAGFEMVWRNGSRTVRVLKGQTVELLAEVRNRDTRAVRFGELRVVASPSVAIEIEAQAGEVPAGGRLEVVVKLRGKRVGHHGLFGLGLELRGSPGLFEVPLTFSNPFGVEVLPALAPARRARLRAGAALAGSRPSRRSGDATEFSEIRDHQLGDPLKRVAWKASARRGKLLVRKYEIEDREVVWFVLDASVELWAGRIGSAPLDLAIDAIADLSRQHLRAGHEVGLDVLAPHLVANVAAGRGTAHERRILDALVATPAALEPGRSGLDERGVAQRVLEHLSTLAPGAAAQIGAANLDGIAGLARDLLEQAPFPELKVAAAEPRESLLRSYLAAFGISLPPRLEPDRSKTDAALVETLSARCRARVTGLVYVVSPFPDAQRLEQLGPTLRQARRTRTRLRWLHPAEVPGLDDPSSAMELLARTAAGLRAQTERRGSELALRRLGISSAVCTPLELGAVDSTNLDPKGHRAA